MEELLTGEIYSLRALIANILEATQDSSSINSWIKEQLEEIDSHTDIN